MAGKKVEKELGLTGSEEEAQQIAKMQAVQRGKIARRERAEQEEAATKIAAIQRGKQDRAAVKGKRIEKELGLTGSPEEQASITKMHAAQRGKQDRARVAELRGGAE